MLNIIVKNITKFYPDKKVFENFSCEFKKSKITAITGRSGSGKSTLLRMIAGLEAPNSGALFIGSESIKKPTKKIFMLNQSYTNFDYLNCLDNVLLPLKVNNIKVDEEKKKLAVSILASLGLEQVEKFPHEMSGGMNQRLALARLMMLPPEVILLDEPTSALDSENTDLVYDFMKKMIQYCGTTFIVVSHDKNLLTKIEKNDIIINIEKDKENQKQI